MMISLSNVFSNELPFSEAHTDELVPRGSVGTVHRLAWMPYVHPVVVVVVFPTLMVVPQTWFPEGSGFTHTSEAPVLSVLSHESSGSLVQSR